MRNPERIDPLLAKLGEAWKKYPDQRFGQFMANFFGTCKRDVFFPEDDVWMVAIQAYIDGKDPNKAMEDYWNAQTSTPEEEEIGSYEDLYDPLEHRDKVAKSLFGILPPNIEE